MSWHLIRYIGDPNPWEDPNLSKALKQGSLPLSIAEKLAFFDKWQKQVLVPGKSWRLLGPESGFSQTYQFGPDQYLVWMAEPDWEHLLSNRWERWQFIEVQPEWDPAMMIRPRMSRDHWMMLLDDFAMLGPGRSAGTKLSQKQLDKDRKQRERVQSDSIKAAEFGFLAEATQTPYVKVEHRWLE